MLSANCTRWVVAGIGLIGVIAALSGAVEPKKEIPAKDVAVPPDLADWKIEFDGFMDQPRQQPNFHVSLTDDGTMLVETWQGKGERRKLFDGKLNTDETRQFFDRTARIINSHEKEKSDGHWGDGWELSLAVGDKKSSMKVSFTQQRAVSDDCAPGLSGMVKLIRGKLKKGVTFPY